MKRIPPDEPRRPTLGVRFAAYPGVCGPAWLLCALATMTIQNIFMLLVMVAMFGLPAYLVIRLGRRGIFLGMAAMWGIGTLALDLAEARHPNESGGIVLWIVGGLAFRACLLSACLQRDAICALPSPPGWKLKA